MKPLYSKAFPSYFSVKCYPSTWDCWKDLLSTLLGRLYISICVCVLSPFLLFVTPWAIACQVPLYLGFPRQEYWHVLPFPPPGHLPDPGIEPTSPALAGRFFTTVSPGKLWIINLVNEPFNNHLLIKSLHLHNLPSSFFPVMFGF